MTIPKHVHCGTNPLECNHVCSSSFMILCCLHTIWKLVKQFQDSIRIDTHLKKSLKSNREHKLARLGSRWVDMFSIEMRSRSWVWNCSSNPLLKSSLNPQPKSLSNERHIKRQDKQATCALKKVNDYVLSTISKLNSTSRFGRSTMRASPVKHFVDSNMGENDKADQASYCENNCSG